MLDLGIHLGSALDEEPNDAPARVGDRRCKLCRKSKDRKLMRFHVSGHILSGKMNHTASTCGYCGQNGVCTIGLKETSRNNSGKIFSPVSNCCYQEKFSLKTAATSSRRIPSTNRPVKCKNCEVVVWSYNIGLHNTETHDEDLISIADIVSSKERSACNECL